MAYDRHGPTWSGPGPIGPLDWQRRALAAVLAEAARSGATPRWHDDAGEWSARLSDGTRMWWSDARSYQRRVALARELGLHGLAAWRLGSADTLTATG